MFLLIDKPKGVTSHDVVDEVRKITGERRVGHAGTLDPNATGLLIVGVGREFTKKLGELTKNASKTYTAEIFLGEERDTDDVEGVITSKAKGILPPSENELRLVIMTFLGKQKQAPPDYSAIKVKGKKAYDIARAGKKPKLKLREVEIKSIKLISYNFPILTIKTEVSSGTYIRSIARDIGKKLGVGAYLKNLERTAVGKHNIESSTKLNLITKTNWKKLAVASL